MARLLPCPLDGVLLFAEGTDAPPEPRFDDEIFIADARGVQRAHFLAGRAAAHAAIAELGLIDEVLAVGPGGEVVWPAGTTGSVSHTHGLAVAALGRTETLLGIGVDVELSTRMMRTKDASLIATESERRWLSSNPFEGDALVRLASAKEVVFKAFFMATGIRLGFHDAELRPVEGGLLARVLLEVPVPRELFVHLQREGEHTVAIGSLSREQK